MSIYSTLFTNPPQCPTYVPMFLFLILWFLAEIAAFIEVGHALGVGGTLLWIIGTSMLGFYLLSRAGFSSWRQGQKQLERDQFPVETAFDSLILPLGALLLILPGFVGDALGLLIFIAPLRQWIYRQIRDNHKERFNSFYSWTYEQRGKTIDGAYRKIDDSRE